MRIGDVLQELWLSRAQIDSALELQRQTGERLGEILVGQGAISRLELAGALSEHWSSLTKLRGPGEPGLPVEVETPWAAEFKALASLIEDLTAKLDAMQSRGDGDVAAQVRRLSVKIDELALAPLDLAAQVERLSVRFEELVLAVPSDEIGALGEGHRRGEEILGRLVSELARLREENDARFGEIASAEAATARVSAEELAALAAAFEGVAAGYEERAVSRDRELTERVERLLDRMGKLAAGALTGQLVARIDALADAQRRGEEALERLLTNGATASERVEATSSPTDLAADPSGALPAKKEEEAQEAQEALALRVARGGTNPPRGRRTLVTARGLALKDGASRHRAALQVRRLRPRRGIALRHLPAAARALCASVLQPLRSSLALAGSALHRMRRSTARVRLGPRSPRVRDRCACFRRILERARTPGSRDRRRRDRRRRRPETDADVVTFVPGDRDRQLRRGHAPAAALAAELASAWTIPLATLLRRRPGIDRQRDLPRAERRRNVVGAFSPRRPSPPNVCLVDDVYTTGSTATACATELRRAGARRVEVVCFARTVR